MNKNMRYAIYGVILVVCLISVILAIYDAVFVESDDQTGYVIPSIGNQSTQTPSEEEEEETMEVRVANFKTLFTNQLYKGNYDTSAIEKLDASQDIVYSAAVVQDKQEMYEVDLNIPLININNEVVQEFNIATQEIFADRANQIMQSATVKTIFDIDYVAYVNGDILSVVIMSNLKEGDQAQRVIVQTYNYNLRTRQKVTAEEILTSLQYDIATVNDEIKRQITQASQDAAILQQSGYEVYGRNPEDSRYQVANADTYFLGENGAFYLIYAYGNQAVTSEMDIIRFD